MIRRAGQIEQQIGGAPLTPDRKFLRAVRQQEDCSCNSVREAEEYFFLSGTHHILLPPQKALAMLKDVLRDHTGRHVGQRSRIFGAVRITIDCFLVFVVGGLRRFVEQYNLTVTTLRRTPQPHEAGSVDENTA